MAEVDWVVSLAALSVDIPLQLESFPDTGIWSLGLVLCRLSSLPGPDPEGLLSKAMVYDLHQDNLRPGRRTRKLSLVRPCPDALGLHHPSAHSQSHLDLLWLFSSCLTS